MAYQIDKTDGTTLVQLLDGVVDTSTDLKLVGRNVSGYGDAQNENFVKLLENFAKADTPPGKPLIGQIWFDKNADKMRPSVFDGARWRNVAINQVAPSTQIPQGQKEGDMWWDTTNKQLYIWDNTNTQHILVGPESVTGFGKTKWEGAKLTDTSGVDHAVVIGYSDGVAQAVISTDTFTNDQTVTPLTDFDNIARGISLNTTSSAGITSGATRFHGTATDADRLGGRLASTWANRNDNEIVTGIWSFQNDSGITIGNTLEMSLKVINADEPAVFNDTGDILRFGVNYTGSGFDKTVFAINGKNVLPYANNEINLGSPSLAWRNIYADSIYANIIGDMVGTHVGNSSGTHNGATVGNHTGNVVDNGGTVILDIDGTTLRTDAGRSGPGSIEGRFEGVAAHVDDGMYRSENQTITGTKTFNANTIIAGGMTIQSYPVVSNIGVRVNNTLQADNVLFSTGTIGEGAISANDPNRNKSSLIINEVTVQNSDITNNIITGGSISSTTIDNVSIGATNSATLVRSQQFKDRLNNTIDNFSTDGTFYDNSDNIIPTQKAIKTYVDNAISSIPQDIQFYLDTKGLSDAQVLSQLNRLAPANNLTDGTEARIIGSYYYADHGIDARGRLKYFQKYGTKVQSGIGYIGGRVITVGAGSSTDLLNKKQVDTSYLFRVVSSSWTLIQKNGF